MQLDKYSIGIGDRFGQQGLSQLRALQLASDADVHISPVWNKSNREHEIIGTHPEDTRREADEAVRVLSWRGPYFVDADHIGASTVDRFIQSSDYFTIDVAEFIGTRAPEDTVRSFLSAMSRFTGSLKIPGIVGSMHVDDQLLRSVAGRYLNCVREVGNVYRYILSRRGEEGFVTEVSLDESDVAQGPEELFLILGALAAEGIPVQTIAPKFTGLFLKGIDYVGDPAAFAREFEQDLAVIAFAVGSFHLPGNLKLSIHTGSDKFSLYPLMHEALRRHDAGIHLKTAGTTWVEEVIGLAETGGEGLLAVKHIYSLAYQRLDELCLPYIHVIQIDKSRLPAPAEVGSWSGEAFAGALCHNSRHPAFNPHFRQLFHVGYRVAAEMGPRFKDLLRRHPDVIGRNITHNIFHRHIVPLFLGGDQQD